MTVRPSFSPARRAALFRTLSGTGPGLFLAAAVMMAVGATAGTFSPIATAQAAEPSGRLSYVDGTDDVPLMPGLRPVADAGMVFETPRGRLVEAYAAGRVTTQAVSDFYARTLPQMGWQSRGPQHWEREGETLSLDFIGRPPNLTVRFSLAPDAN